MSKINARSPFYLSYTTPTAPTPEFTCTIANLTGFEVDQEGVIKEPSLAFGSIKSLQVVILVLAMASMQQLQQLQHEQ